MRVCVPTKAPGTVLRLARWKRDDGVIEPILKQKRQGRFQELPDRGGAGSGVGSDIADAGAGQMCRPIVLLKLYYIETPNQWAIIISK